jgi:hypothetical protein
MTGRYAGARSFCYGLALLLAPLAGAALYDLNPAVLWAACGTAGICAAAVITRPPVWLCRAVGRCRSEARLRTDQAWPQDWIGS